jgi:hypothetical protein
MKRARQVSLAKSPKHHQARKKPDRDEHICGTADPHWEVSKRDQTDDLEGVSFDGCTAIDWPEAYGLLLLTK